MHGREVEHLAGDLEPPQVGLQAGLGLHDVRRHVIEPGGQRAPCLEVVGPPVGGEGGVEAVGDQGGSPTRSARATASSANGTARAGWPA